MLAATKKVLKKLPILETALKHVTERIRKQPALFSSSHYWEARYRSGGNSGPGSYNRLAEFKAETLNTFVQKNRIDSVIEFGCGDGAQLELMTYASYTGIDVSPIAIKICSDRMAGDSSKSFYTVDMMPTNLTADLALSLDVIFHLVEDSVFDVYMHRLFKSANCFVIVYSSNEDKSWPANHVRHRQFTRWIERNKPEWLFQEIIKNKYPYDPNDEINTSFADFYIYRRSHN